tara:strand:+ start:704 stop:880 length:177 start_codon:yes stop_codon:yes gene_type:complete
VKPGDLIKTTGFGPNGNVGEVGVIIKAYPRIIRCWEILFGSVVRVLAEDGLEVINEAR